MSHIRIYFFSFSLTFLFFVFYRCTHVISNGTHYWLPHCTKTMHLNTANGSKYIPKNIFICFQNYHLDLLQWSNSTIQQHIETRKAIIKAKAPSPPSMKAANNNEGTTNNDNFYLQLTQDDKYYSNESSYCWNHTLKYNHSHTKQIPFNQMIPIPD